jgi:hypothetical protein
MLDIFLFLFRVSLWFNEPNGMLKRGERRRFRGAWLARHGKDLTFPRIEAAYRQNEQRVDVRS